MIATSKTKQLTAFEVSGEEQIVATSARVILAEARIVEFTPLGVRGSVRIGELCNENFSVITSANTLRALARELLEVADQADQPASNLADIRELIDNVASEQGARQPDESQPSALPAMKEHAHYLQTALLYVADYEGHGLNWVKQSICALTLDTTLGLITHVAVPNHYRKAINAQLSHLPGFVPVSRLNGFGPPNIPVQNQEVYRHYGFFVGLVQRAGAAL